MPAPDAAELHVEIVVPVRDEAHVLAESIDALVACTRAAPFRTMIVIVDNASTDATLAVAERCAASHPEVSVRHLDQAGRGRAVRSVWATTDADIAAYVDVDLSTDLRHLVPLVEAIAEGGADLAVGSRLAPGADTSRSTFREVLSQGYNAILRLALHTRVRDAQCGFKAIRADVARKLLPQIEDEVWFFDTELIWLTEREGLRIAEIPVRWVEDRDSRVRVVPTVVDDLRGVWRLRRAARRDR